MNKNNTVNYITVHLYLRCLQDEIRCITKLLNFSKLLIFVELFLVLHLRKKS